MWCKSYKSGCAVTIKVTPKASRNSVLGAESEWLRLALTAPPVDGKANAAAQLFLAERCNLPKRSVKLISGQTARLKIFALEGLSPEAAEALLLSKA